MRPQPLLAKLARSAIAVHDVEASSPWYHQVLGCQSAHGGPIDERLTTNGVLVLQLHHVAVEDHHGPIADPNAQPYGNGVLLWFAVDGVDAAVARAAELQAEVVLSRHRNPPDGDGGPNHWECSLRGREGSTVVLASPDSSAQGATS